MRLDKKSLDILKKIKAPALFKIKNLSDNIAIEPIEDKNIAGNILIYSADKDYAFDLIFEYKDTIDYLLFLDANSNQLELLAKPSSNVNTIESVFDRLTANSETFEKRLEQIELSKKIKESIENHAIGLFEAPTGTGKSLAYLTASVLYAKKHKKRVVISTNTINLQKQLIEKDIPILKDVVDFNVRIAVGRGNYVCKRKVDKLFETSSAFLFDNDLFEKLKIFTKHSKTGLKSDFFDKDSKLDNSFWELIQSQSVSCAKTKCPYFRNRCFYYKAHKSLETADIIIANHHLVLSDSLLKNAEILPDYQILIFDEAHNLEKNATNHFTKTASTSQIRYLLDKLYTKKKNKKLGYLSKLDDNQIGNLNQNIIQLKKHLKSFYIEKNSITSETAINEDKISTIEKPIQSLIEQIDQVIIKTKSLKKFFDEGSFLDITSIVQQLEEQLYILTEFLDINDKANTRWIKQNPNFTHFNITPLNIAEELKSAIFDQVESVVFISATISVNNDFGFFKKNLGIEDSNEFIAKNNFDYRNISKLIITQDAPPPDSSTYSDFLAKNIESIAKSAPFNKYGCLILFTSYKMLNETYDKVYNSLSELDLSILRQGDFDNFRILNELKQKKGFLFATSSFWEGVDVKGDALSVVIITRLPFEVPNTPIEQSRYRIMKENGINAFFEYSLPKAVLKFRQGFGRLIRSSEDRGLIIVTDSRIIKKSYGKTFYESLPDIKKEVVNSYEVEDSVGRFFNTY